MKLAIMQPYFFPYIGYFQLIASVDKFIVYDNIKYTKRGWINRNRILLNGSEAVFSVPLKNDSDFLNINQRVIANSFDGNKLLAQLKGAYFRAPYYEQTYPLLNEIIKYPDQNLFLFIQNSIIKICQHIGITTQIQVSSDIKIDHSLKSQDKVIAICRACDADMYINPIGGLELYDSSVFHDNGIQLQFLESLDFEYSQFGNIFIPWLSIVDVLMFNSLPFIQDKVFSAYFLK